MVVPEVQLTVEEQVTIAEEHLKKLNDKLDNETSWFTTNGCLKVLVIFSFLAIIAFSVCMFILGRQVAKIDH